MSSTEYPCSEHPNRKHPYAGIPTLSIPSPGIPTSSIPAAAPPKGRALPWRSSPEHPCSEHPDTEHPHSKHPNPEHSLPKYSHLKHPSYGPFKRENPFPGGNEEDGDGNKFSTWKKIPTLAQKLPALAGAANGTRIMFNWFIVSQWEGKGGEIVALERG